MKKLPTLMSTAAIKGPMFRVCKDGGGDGEVVELSSVMTLATGQAQAGENIRIEQWNGRDYTVVPVVAIVEGVLHGANAKHPEFAAASEFGKFPRAWDGRPVVMNHPQINGVFVSAGMPEVLTDFGMGLMFNTNLDGKKLKCEAWLDHERIEAAGGEMFETLERIRNNEVVEVSVGAWIDVIPRVGSYSGKAYQGVWSGVAPDHLAFLSKGTTGACSVADGCGVPRLFSVNAAAIGSPAACCDDCAKSGGSCEGKAPNSLEAAPPAGNTDGSTPTRQPTSAEALLTLERRGAAHEVVLEELSVHAVDDKGGDLSVNKVPGNMAFADIKVLVFQGLLELLNAPPYDVDISCITSSQVVYHIWGKAGLWGREYTVNEEGAIKFSADETAVNLLTRIVPRQATEPSVNQSERNDEMADNTNGAASETPAAGAEGGEGQEAVTQQAPNANASAPTFDQLLAASSGETRESIEYGQRMFKARKEELVKGIVACERNAFTEDQLNAMAIDQLENLATLAGATPNYTGRAIPAGQEGISANADGGSNKGMKVATVTQSYLGKTDDK